MSPIGAGHMSPVGAGHMSPAAEVHMSPAAEGAPRLQPEKSKSHAPALSTLPGPYFLLKKLFLFAVCFHFSVLETTIRHFICVINKINLFQFLRWLFALVSDRFRRDPSFQITKIFYPEKF